MPASRSEVSAFDSIHRASWVTGANAIVASSAGSGAPPDFDRTNRSCGGGGPMPGSIGFHSVAGASVGAMLTLRGPVRRSRYGAIDWRHESAACCRSAAVIVTCISFSASANVAADTTGPDAVPAPKVGGAPGVADADGDAGG